MKRYDRIEKNRSTLVHSRTETEKAPNSHVWFYYFLFIAFMGGAIYLTLFSGLLSIKKYEVQGYAHPETIETLAEEESEKLFLGDNILFFRASYVRSVILGDSTVENVKIKRKFPETIVLEIEETTPEIIWNSAGDKYLVSDRGEVMGKAEEQKLPEIFDAVNVRITAGERVASPTFVLFIKTISSKFEGATGTSIARINILDILSDVHVVSSDGWTVYLNSSKDADSQLKNLTRVLAEVKSAGVKKLEYIDMRIESKIFYK